MARWLTSVVLGFLVAAAPAQAEEASPDFFAPPAFDARRRVTAVRASGPLEVDGVLDEASWAAAPAVSDFVQVEPRQGAPAHHRTEVRVLYDDTTLYVSARLEQPGGWQAFNQRDLRRDFGMHECDSFGVVLDTFGDQRNAFSFHVNPWGAQRDLQVSDGTLFEDKWDTVWVARTQRDARGWTVELAIPFSSIRFGGPGVKWGIQFFRRERGVNEDTAFSPFPRNASAWRMTYAGVLEGLEPPQGHSGAWQLRPYAVVHADHAGSGPLEVGPSVGGELTWNPVPGLVTDLTVNTDFAETDVDRRVVNLSRFSVFFPERRQFFLESAGVFSAGWVGTVQPFFSRRVGLYDDQPVPILAGLRSVYRTSERSAGVLLVTTLPSGGAPGEVFGVARYSHNLGEQSRVGAMVVVDSELLPGGRLGGPTNVVPVLDGFARFGGFSLAATAMGSSTDSPATSVTPATHSLGAAGTLTARVEGNWGSASLGALGISPGFDARAGFVGRQNVVGLVASEYTDWRPTFLPAWLRSWGPTLDAAVYLSADQRKFQELNVDVNVLHLLFAGGDEAGLEAVANTEHLDAAFTPVPGVSIPAGDYQYEQVGLWGFSQASRKIAGGASAYVGQYYTTGTLSASANLSAQVLPHVQVAATYGYNRFWGTGVTHAGGVAETHLLLLETRLALSPQLQLIGSFQRDSAGNGVITNARIAWEFLPLSFLYIVFTDTRPAFGAPDAVVPEQQVVAKLTYTWRL